MNICMVTIVKTKGAIRKQNKVINFHARYQVVVLMTRY